MIRQESISRVIEGGPDHTGGISEDEVTCVVEGGGGDAAASGVGLPDDGAGGIDEAEVAVAEEPEGGGGIGGAGITAGFPDWDAVVGDGGEVCGAIGDETYREGVVWGLP